ncbi:MAG: hypothetical protein IID32_11485, partial [Planctomycetes bacterium]|nr:hypothetical protein [Planctomycetota bacterium]
MVTATSKSVYAKTSRAWVLSILVLLWVAPLFGADDSADPQNNTSEIQHSEDTGHDDASQH